MRWLTGQIKARGGELAQRRLAGLGDLAGERYDAVVLAAGLGSAQLSGGDADAYPIRGQARGAGACTGGTTSAGARQAAAAWRRGSMRLLLVPLTPPRPNPRPPRPCPPARRADCPRARAVGAPLRVWPLVGPRGDVHHPQPGVGRHRWDRAGRGLADAGRPGRSRRHHAARGAGVCLGGAWGWEGGRLVVGGLGRACLEAVAGRGEGANGRAPALCMGWRRPACAGAGRRMRSCCRLPCSPASYLPCRPLSRPRHQLLPSLASAELLDNWVGLRPGRCGAQTGCRLADTARGVAATAAAPCAGRGACGGARFRGGGAARGGSARRCSAPPPTAHRARLATGSSCVWSWSGSSWTKRPPAVAVLVVGVLVVGRQLAPRPWCTTMGMAERASRWHGGRRATRCSWYGRRWHCERGRGHHAPGRTVCRAGHRRAPD